jgi:hypothetical protein
MDLLDGAGATDAVWAGNVVMRTAIVSDVIDSVIGTQPDVDAAFSAALARQPPSATPDQVRAALREAATSGLTTPPLTDTELDVLLHAFASGSGDPRRWVHRTRASGMRRTAASHHPVCSMRVVRHCRPRPPARRPAAEQAAHGLRWRSCPDGRPRHWRSAHLGGPQAGLTGLVLRRILSVKGLTCRSTGHGHPVTSFR